MTLIRHILLCNNARLPGERLPVRVAERLVGWAEPATAKASESLGARVDEAGLHFGAEQLPLVARKLSAAGLFRWRHEAFDVRADPDSPVLAQIDRGALPLLGIGAIGVHVNGLVGDRLWVARRARNKPLDPGKLDHLVAGGVAAGDTVEATVVKEAAEEAGLSAELAARARRVSRVRYAAERPEGLRRDTLYCFDLELPPDWRPNATDGEVEAFELWPLERALETVRETDEFKFNVNLVLIDLFLRRGLVAKPEAQALRTALSRAG